MPRWMAVALFHVVGSGTVMAQCTGEFADRSRRYYETGAVHYLAHRYAKAIVELEKAYELCADTELLFDLAQAHRKLGQREEALAYYHQYVERDPVGRMRVQAGRFIELIEQDLGRRAPRGVQSSATASGDAAGSVDDELLSPARSLAEPPPMGSAATASPVVPPKGSPGPAVADRSVAAVPSTIVPLPTRGPEPRPNAMDDRRLWKRWWLWTSVGGGLLLGAGVVTAVALSQRFDPPIEGSLGGWGGP